MELAARRRQNSTKGAMPTPPATMTGRRPSRGRAKVLPSGPRHCAVSPEGSRDSARVPFPTTLTSRSNVPRSRSASQNEYGPPEQESLLLGETQHRELPRLDGRRHRLGTEGEEQGVGGQLAALEQGRGQVSPHRPRSIPQRSRPSASTSRTGEGPDAADLPALGQPVEAAELGEQLGHVPAGELRGHDARAVPRGEPRSLEVAIPRGGLEAAPQGEVVEEALMQPVGARTRRPRRPAAASR